MQITELLQIENDRRGYLQMCLDCEAYRLKDESVKNTINLTE